MIKRKKKDEVRSLVNFRLKQDHMKEDGIISVHNNFDQRFNNLLENKCLTINKKLKNVVEIGLKLF